MEMQWMDRLDLDTHFYVPTKILLVQFDAHFLIFQSCIYFL